MFCTFSLQNVLFATAACNFSTSELQKVLRERQFLTFSLPNVLFATAACNFSTSEQQKVLRSWRALYIFTSKCAFHTVACDFWFLCWGPTSAPAALTGLLFDWPDTRIIEKTQHFATSLTFGADVFSFFWLSRYCIFFLLTWLLYSAFQLSILSEVCYLNFLRPYLPSKHPKRLVEEGYHIFAAQLGAGPWSQQQQGWLTSKKPIGWVWSNALP